MHLNLHLITNIVPTQGTEIAKAIDLSIVNLTTLYNKVPYFKKLNQGRGKSDGNYRGLVKISKGATNSRNFSQCDSLLMGDKCGSHTFPYIEVKNNSSKVEHEATTSKIGEDQIFYCNQRGIGTEAAIALIVNGYCKDVLNQLPMEFAVEAQKLLEISLEGSVG